MSKRTRLVELAIKDLQRQIDYTEGIPGAWSLPDGDYHKSRALMAYIESLEKRPTTKKKVDKAEPKKDTQKRSDG